MRKLFFRLILATAVVLAACGEGDSETPSPTEEATEAQSTEAPAEESPTEVPPTEEPSEAEPTEAPAEESPSTTESPLTTMEHVPDPMLIDITWEWERRDTSSGETEFIVPNPDAYTIVFNADGTLNATLDCNSAGGQYKTPTPGNIFMELGAMTAAACGESSLGDDMANMFGPAQSYRFEDDGQVLAFIWAAGGPIDYYRDASAAGVADVGSIPPDALQIDLQGLAETYSWTVQEGSPIPPGPGGLGFPPHILVTFDGETAEEALANNSNRMYIFPTQAYINLYESAGREDVTNQVARLEQLISEAEERQTLPESPMPLLPPPSSFMDRWVQFSDLDFGVGRGVRYVSEAPNRQSIGAWTNQGTAYYYQGLTTDGNFYVSLKWAVSTEALPNSPEDVPPEVNEVANNPETYPTYLQETKDTLNALPTSAWNPDLARLDAMSASITFPTAAEAAEEGEEDKLVGPTWQWVSTTSPSGETAVNDPTRYTITFNEDGSAAVKADCNNVQVTYTTDGSSITINTLGPSTLAACPADSLDQQFMASLANVAVYSFEGDDLLLDMAADAGTMRFTAEDTVELPEPDAGDPTATVIAPDGVFIRTGPGTEYPSIGAAPFGATGEIVGVSEDGEWWVMASPDAPNEQGWVSAQFIEATNAENVPVVPTPPLEPALTGTNWQWVSTTTPTGVTAVNDPSRYTVLFNEDGTAAIKADCNNVTASYTVDGSSINIVLGASTLAACPPDSLEQQYLLGLGNAAIYFFQEGDLFMDMVADGGTMRFSATQVSQPIATPPAPVATPDPDSPTSGAQGIEFQLVSYGPVGAEQPVLEGTLITALFSDTEVVGLSGCNNYAGTVTPVNDFFTIGPIVTTQKTCAEPAGIMEQEQAYLAALAGTNGYQWQGTPVATAGQLRYLLADGTSGVLNFIAR